MKIRVTQCSVGTYNILSNEESLSFYMSMYDDENKVIEQDGVKAQLHYSGDPDDIYRFEDAMNNIEEVFRYCLEYSKRVWSSIDYESQCLLFYKLYQENFELLEKNTKEARDARIKKQIEELQRQLTHDCLNDLSWEFKRWKNNQIEQINKSIERLANGNLELKDDSETYKKNLTSIEKYKNKIEYYNQLPQYEN